MGEINILFISHSAGRTGAVISLLNFMEWLKEHSQANIYVLIKEKGDLLDKFELIANVKILDTGLKGFLLRLSRKLKFSVAERLLTKWVVKRFYPPGSIDVICSNTATNHFLLEALTYQHCPVVSIIHELDTWIREIVGRDKFRTTIRLTNHFIAVSLPVKKNLIQTYQVAGDIISLIPEIVPVRKIAQQNFQFARKEIRKHLSIPVEAKVIGAIGWLGWHKGPDLFVEAAAQVIDNSHTDTYFVWVGGKPKKSRFSPLITALRGISEVDRVIFIDAVANPLHYMAAFDVFCLSSREDSFPLVMLEAAAVGLPIVCFENSGGAPYFVEDDAGIIVEERNSKILARSLLLLLEHPEIREGMGKRAREKVLSNYDVEHVAPRILEVLIQVMNEGSRR